MEKYLHLLSRGDKIGLTLIRLSIAIVFMWIGLLKFVPYEADSITPFVANSPLMLSLIHISHSPDVRVALDGSDGDLYELPGPQHEMADLDPAGEYIHPDRFQSPECQHPATHD